MPEIMTEGWLHDLEAEVNAKTSGCAGCPVSLRDDQLRALIYTASQSVLALAANAKKDAECDRLRVLHNAEKRRADEKELLARMAHAEVGHANEETKRLEQELAAVRSQRRGLSFAGLLEEVRKRAPEEYRVVMAQCQEFPQGAPNLKWMVYTENAGWGEERPTAEEALAHLEERLHPKVLPAADPASVDPVTPEPPLVPADMDPAQAQDGDAPKSASVDADARVG